MSGTEEEALPDHSGVVIAPPMTVFMFFLIGIALQRFVPLPGLPMGIGRTVGAVLALLWLLLLTWSLRRLWASGTSVLPLRPTTALVIEGPYRFTRNPMYVGLLLLYAGVACWFGLTWPLLLAPILVWVIDVWVIQREEQYLARKFGDEYRQYQRQVRRWL